MEKEHDPRYVHYTTLGPGPSDGPCETEWRTYLREVGRLLAEGHEGKFALLRGEEVVGLFDTFDDAYAEGLRRYLLGPFLIQKVREWEPLFDPRLGYRWIA